jgi:BNR repeat-containing family member
MSASKRIAIIGDGVTGLAAAHGLHELDPTLELAPPRESMSSSMSNMHSAPCGVDAMRNPLVKTAASLFWRRHLQLMLIFVVVGGALACPAAPAFAEEPGQVIILNDDGAWCWFQDERAVVCGSTLFVGSVANGTNDTARKGDVEVTAYDLISGRLTRSELHDQLEPDDHAVPALWPRSDGRLLAVYSKHGSESHFYCRLTRVPGDPSEWLPETTYAPSAASRITYSNLHFLAAENDGNGRLYNFFRGLDASFKPSFVSSDDEGQSWSRGNVLIDVPLAFRHRPYVKYASDGRDTIHFLYTDGHPRDFDNSVYHIFYREGQLHRSDGGAIGPLAMGLRSPDEGTCVFRGDAENVAWVSDLHLSADGRPYAVYSVQRDSVGFRSGHALAGQDHRYRYAWWDGAAWRDYEIAYAGTRLYAGEDDYTGNICLDPDRLETVYLSANVHPATGEPLISAADGQRHFEIYRGTTADRGETWTWHAITRNSTVDNLRPLVPKWDGVHTAILWFRGTYRTYRDYQTEVVGLIGEDPR